MIKVLRTSLLTVSVAGLSLANFGFGGSNGATMLASGTSSLEVVDCLSESLEDTSKIKEQKQDLNAFILEPVVFLKP